MGTRRTSRSSQGGRFQFHPPAELSRKPLTSSRGNQGILPSSHYALQALQSLHPPVSHYALQSVTMLCSHYALRSLRPPVTTLSGHYEPAPQPYEPVPQPCGYTLPCVHPHVAPRVDVQGPPSRDPSVRGFLCPVLGTAWPSGSIVSLTKGCRDREPASCPHAACRGEACVVSARTKPSVPHTHSQVMFCQGSERGWWRSPEMVCTQKDGFHPCQSRGPKMWVLLPFPVLSGRSGPMGSPQASVSSSAQKYKASPQLPHRAVGGSNEPGQEAVCENVRHAHPQAGCSRAHGTLACLAPNPTPHFALCSALG